MSEPTESPSPTVDVAFALRGACLPRDHACAMAAVLTAQLPWLRDDRDCGVHRVKVVAGNGPSALLSRRARLILRVPRQRVAELLPLEGATLDVAGCRLQLGSPVVHELLPHSTLYAPVVACAQADERLFLESVNDELRSLGVHGRPICGRASRMQGDGAAIDGFSLMLDGLSPHASLRLQERGLGPHRVMGCGVFVPHRSAAALHGSLA